ncbi:ABC transporter substrate-binding protein [Haloarchaeobius sp. TZWSO28]|uniref:ABC transporter substrate-binding protein n=1 Tax=Haloarchaeobius sp. TZWSO28 TaxID=3446119 RepID=UPI003EC0D4AE
MSSFDGSRLSRRRFVQAAAGTGIAGLAGCVGGLTGGSGGGDPLNVAYMPIYPDMQHFVMDQQGYYDDLSVPVEAELFSDGPSIVQAFAKGDYDVALFGVVPAMIIVDKTGFAKVTGANIEEAMLIMASDEFAALYDEHGADAFAKFEEQKGRKFTFGTFPPGSVPDILLRYWLDSELGLDPESDVNIKSLGGAGPVRQALVAGKVDGTSIMEPVPTIVQSKGAGYQNIAWAGDFMSGQPAAVTMMHDRLRNERPELAKDFLRQHQRATEFINANPDKAAEDAASVIGKDVLPVDIAQQAMESKGANFISDPHRIEGGAKIFAEYASRLGKTEQQLSISDIFDYSLYDEVANE